MKILESTTLENGINIQLIEKEFSYQIVSSVSGYPETFAHLDKALTSYNKRITLFDRFKCTTIN